MNNTYKTACPLNCYDVCGLVVTENDGIIVDIKGDKDHPITKGKICSKGKMLKDRMYDSRRILYPLKKVNEKFQRISWEQAIDEISGKMAQLKESYGPTAILHSYDYASGGLIKELDKRFFNYFGGMTETKGSLCWGAGKQAQIYDFGNAISHSVEDIKNAESIIIWGRNITATNMHLLSFILAAKKEGARVVVIDPIRNDIAKHADFYLKVRPGMDGILALAVSKMIVDNHWVDRSFIDQNTVGFHSYTSILNEIDIEKAAEETDITMDEMKQLASIYSLQGPVMTFLGLGMQRYKNGGNTVRAIDALSALTGNIGKKGAGVNFANLSVGKSFNMEELLQEESRTDYRMIYRPTVFEDIIRAENPPIKMMFVTRNNPVLQASNNNKAEKALNKVETKVVIDMYMTDTAKMADYVLPTTSVFEEEDIYYGSMFHGIIRYGPQIVEPPGEAWSDYKIWTALAKKLGLDGFEKTRDEIFKIALKPLKKDGLELELFKGLSQFQLPLVDIPWEDYKFETPSGKFEFFSDLATKDGLPPTVIVSYPEERVNLDKDKRGKFPYHLLTIHPKQSLHSQNHFLLKDKEPIAYVAETIAEERGLKDNQLITIYNERGQIQAKVRITNKVQRETIVVEEGHGMDTGGAVNKLTSDHLSDMGKGSTQYDCAVNII